jgi:hypothetical protein
MKKSVFFFKGELIRAPYVNTITYVLLRYPNICKKENKKGQSSNSKTKCEC